MSNFLIETLSDRINYEKYLKSLGYSSDSLRIDRRMSMSNFWLKFGLRRRFGKDNRILEEEKIYYNKVELTGNIIGSNRKAKDPMEIQYLVRIFIEFLLYVEENYFIDISEFYEIDEKNKTSKIIVNSVPKVTFTIKYTETEIDYMDEGDEFKFKLLDFLNDDKKPKEEKVVFYSIIIDRENSYSNEFNAIYPKAILIDEKDEIKFKNACYKIREFIDITTFRIINNIIWDYI